MDNGALYSQMVRQFNDCEVLLERVEQGETAHISDLQRSLNSLLQQTVTLLSQVVPGDHYQAKYVITISNILFLVANFDLTFVDQQIPTTYR
jgi:hypothetical protein